MKGDFTRLTFDPAKHYSRVLMQQGRAQLDADWNELVEMQLHFLRTLAADLIGPHGGPGDSFKIEKIEVANNELSIKDGHYYVDGILCENGAPLQYAKQPGFSTGNLENGKSYLLYLDVWERHVTHIEDEDENRAGIREVALRGPDTATRAQIVWQAKPFELRRDELPPTNDNQRAEKLRRLGDDKLSALRNISNATLKARAISQRRDDDPCVLSPKSQYRGAENQLYRVEIHRSGRAWDGSENTKNGAATFKWSRENGSALFPIRNVEGDTVTLEHLGRDSRFGLRPDDWVEIVDDDYTLRNRAEPLLQIKEIDSEKMRVTLKASPAADVGRDDTKHRFLRRWDSPGAANVQIPTANDGWIPLEDNVEIKFGFDANSLFRTGDYWLIPARVATGDVEWPGPKTNPAAAPPHGVAHHFAPLAIVSVNGQVITIDGDLRRKWNPSGAITFVS